MNKQVIIKNEDSFEPKHIFECGQCFRWKREDNGSYTVVAHNKVINVLKENDSVIINNTTEQEWSDIWYNYFDIGTDYGHIKTVLSEYDDHIKKAVEFGGGIRILNQDLWECVVSFIISANNNIPRIQGIIDRLCRRFGDEIRYNGESYYTFPKPESITGDLSFLRAGYRDSYIQDACKSFMNGEFTDINKLSTEDARKKLMTIKGVGPKVADCILLFGLGRREVFPVDVWVKRCISVLYKKETEDKLPHEFAKEYFKTLAGYAQQYLFYHMREVGIDKTGGIKNVKGKNI